MSHRSADGGAGGAGGDVRARAEAGIERLAEQVACEPGGPLFSVLAEAYRRAGRAEDALRIARAGVSEAPERPAGRVALALLLLAGDEPAAARQELARALEAEAAAAGLGGVLAAVSSAASGSEDWSHLRDEELSRALDEAVSHPEAMLDAHQVAQRAIAQCEAEGEDLAESGEAAEGQEAPATSFSPVAHPAFATRTMAELLERQGDRAGAEAIRRSLDAERRPARPNGALETLERWLRNTRRRRVA